MHTFHVQLCSNLLLKDVHRRLVGLQLLVLQEDLPLQLQRRRQVGVIAEVALEEEARHKTLPKHHLKREGTVGRDINGWRPMARSAHKVRQVERKSRSYQKSNNISGKQAPDDISRLEAQSYLKMKGVSLSDHKKVKSLREERTLGSWIEDESRMMIYDESAACR